MKGPEFRFGAGKRIMKKNRTHIPPAKRLTIRTFGMMSSAGKGIPLLGKTTFGALLMPNLPLLFSLRVEPTGR
jgi:hypothetical protein